MSWENIKNQNIFSFQLDHCCVWEACSFPARGFIDTFIVFCLALALLFHNKQTVDHNSGNIYDHTMTHMFFSPVLLSTSRTETCVSGIKKNLTVRV